MKAHWLAAVLIAAFGAEIALAENQQDYQPLVLADRQVSWRPAAGGGPTVVSFAMITGAIQTRGARNCASMVPVDDLLARSAVEPAQFEDELLAAFAMWEAAADIRYVRSEGENSADILIGAQGEPTGFAFTNVTHGATPETASSIVRSLICLNPDRHWKVGFDGNLGSLDLRYVLAHEIGHAIGLDHPGSSGQLMSYRYEERFRTLQDGDKRGAARIYGANGGAREQAAPGVGTASGPAVSMGISGPPAKD